MSNRIGVRTAIAAAGMLSIALTGCVMGGDPSMSPTGAASTPPATSVASATGASTTGAGTVRVEIDGSETGDWGPASCEDHGEGKMILTSSTGDGGELQLRVGSASDGLDVLVTITLPGGGDEFRNNAGGDFVELRDVYTFAGLLSNAPQGATRHVEALIEVDCSG